MRNPDLTFPIREDIGHLEIHLENLCVGMFTGNGEIIDLGGTSFSIEDLETIIRKSKEVQKHGKRPPVCEVCGATPYFPNMKPKDAVFEEHLCTAPMHLTSPR